MLARGPLVLLLLAARAIPVHMLWPDKNLVPCAVLAHTQRLAQIHAFPVTSGRGRPMLLRRVQTALRVLFRVSFKLRMQVIALFVMLARGQVQDQIHVQRVMQVHGPSQGLTHAHRVLMAHGRNTQGRLHKRHACPAALVPGPIPSHGAVHVCLWNFFVYYAFYSSVFKAHTPTAVIARRATDNLAPNVSWAT